MNGNWKVKIRCQFNGNWKPHSFQFLTWSMELNDWVLYGVWCIKNRKKTELTTERMGSVVVDVLSYASFVRRNNVIESFPDLIGLRSLVWINKVSFSSSMKHRDRLYKTPIRGNSIQWTCLNDRQNLKNWTKFSLRLDLFFFAAVHSRMTTTTTTTRS